jgi:hypothetical protein
VVDNTGGTGIVWVTTADPTCAISNLTNGTGEAACADSDAAGLPATPYDTELVSNPFDLTGFGAAVLDVKAYYNDITTGGNDRFEVDVWNGTGWTNELTWDEDHTPEDFSLNLSAYAGLPTVQVRFRYFGNGYDWYAQVDDVALTCVPVGGPVIEVDPLSLTESQGPDDVSTQELYVGNTGGSALNWTIVEDDTACDSPADIPWLSVAPNAGTTVPLDRTTVDVTFDSTGLTPGGYTASLCVNSNDASTPLVQVPVSLTVENPVLLECNGAAIAFEDGIPSGFQVVDNTGGAGIVWVTTADPACAISNMTNGTGEAACADSDAAGPGAPAYDTELWSNLIDLSGYTAATLDVKGYYRDISTGTNDRFEVDIWNGSSWTTELSWDEDHEPEDFALDLAAYAGMPNVRVRFRYFGNGFDWYAQVDDVALTCGSTLSIDDVTIAEGDAGTVNATFTVSLSPASGQQVTVDYATADNTAVAGTDYQAASGPLTFSAGTTTQPVTVVVNGDLLDEQDETFFVNLSNPVNATIADGEGQGTITDDDAPPAISIDDVTVIEGDSGTVNAVFTVSLSAASGQEVKVDYATADGTALAGTDYQAGSGIVTFAAGITTQPVTVVVNGDTSDEPDETLFVNLSNPVNATIADGQGRGTIADDENPSIVVEKRTIPAGDPDVFTFTGDVAGVIGDGQHLVLSPAPGTYTSTEVVPSGWSLFKCKCDDADSVGDTGTATATIELGADESVTCVFTNCSDSVASTLDLSGVTVSSTEVYEACDTLTADTFTIESTGVVHFRAGHRIVLENGFSIESGGELVVEIVGEP